MQRQRCRSGYRRYAALNRDKNDDPNEELNYDLSH